ncbi:putative fatty acyl-CoA reductase CG5065 [Anticarsia gemmatalis]|uniref:putative fatty acyl-CoA reductase CG5065 n=1 Tax=Anticarsia gemmatalis TaxID=129554 RepID=UPI003F772271
MAPLVTEYYRGKSIFITGGTGFVGKAVIEKLLRCCPDIGTIYLLLRQKKGLSSEERLKELCSQRVFDLIRAQNPDSFKKLRVIGGDITEDQLGISEEDRKTLQKNVNIIFHSAACVRFDQKLKDEVNMNTTGTWRVLSLAETVENLEVFIHLSTAYCRCDLDVLDEKVYPAVHSPRKIMDIVSWMDDDTLDYLEPKLISSEPNTYSYTKAITEDLVAEYGDKFPVAIARPSIITAALKEPMPGWVDNINGPTGLVIGSGKGVIRSMHCEPSYNADAISVDIVANACILIAYATAIDKPKETKVYNLTLSGVVKITWAQIIEYGEKWVNEYPFTVALWYPGGSIKSYRLTHQIDMFLTQTLPAYLCDALLFLLGKKTFMIKLQKRISHGLDVIQYYTTKQWNFKNTNYQGLRKRITKEEDEIFFTDLSNIDPYRYLESYVLGIREYVCKEDPSTLPRARKLHRIRYFADRILKLIFITLFLWFLYSNISVFQSSVEFLDNTLKSLPPINQVRAEDVLGNGVMS